MTLLVRVTVLNFDGSKLAQYTMNHDDPKERQVLGEQCRNAFEAWQSINTVPIGKGDAR